MCYLSLQVQFYVTKEQWNTVPALFLHCGDARAVHRVTLRASSLCPQVLSFMCCCCLLVSATLTSHVTHWWVFVDSLSLPLSLVLCYHKSTILKLLRLGFQSAFIRMQVQALHKIVELFKFYYRNPAILHNCGGGGQWCNHKGAKIVLGS